MDGFVRICISCGSNDAKIRNDALLQIEQFQSNNNALDVCIQILQQPSSPPVAVFHALRISRVLLISRSAQEQLEVFPKLVSALRSFKDLSQQCAFVCGSLFKLTWLDMKQKQGTVKLLAGRKLGVFLFFSFSCFNSSCQGSDFVLIRAILFEMDVVKCSGINRPLKYHLRCHFEFQEKFVLILMQKCIELPLNAPNLLSMIETLLSWTWIDPG